MVSHTSPWLRPPIKLIQWLFLKARIAVGTHQAGAVPSLTKYRRVADQRLRPRPQVEQEVALRGHVDTSRPKDREDEQFIGGLRHAHLAAKKLPFAKEAGRRLVYGLDEYVDTA